jgi:hypothetical protein
MGLILLAILIAPLPLLLAITSWELFSPDRPVRVESVVRISPPRPRRHRS